MEGSLSEEQEQIAQEMAQKLSQLYNVEEEFEEITEEEVQSILPKLKKGLRQELMAQIICLQSIAFQHQEAFSWAYTMKSFELPITRNIGKCIMSLHFPGIDPMLASSWRPISLLICFSKLLELLLQKRFSGHLEL
eukprot:TRINITY_DN21244_c0_g1_i2.p2 TRINITY_DN21244_c0_g1~~TRINITY_DN21244_c0_g1_i2.p2  ORF type:complete len:136 (+),score=8.82 TRINITY_DN21244_c0_g1_i2:95-502(+)